MSHPIASAIDSLAASPARVMNVASWAMMAFPPVPPSATITSARANAAQVTTCCTASVPGVCVARAAEWSKIHNEIRLRVRATGRIRSIQIPIRATKASAHMVSRVLASTIPRSCASAIRGTAAQAAKSLLVQATTMFMSPIDANAAIHLPMSPSNAPTISADQVTIVIACACLILCDVGVKSVRQINRVGAPVEFECECDADRGFVKAFETPQAVLPNMLADVATYQCVLNCDPDHTETDGSTGTTCVCKPGFNGTRCEHVIGSCPECDQDVISKGTAYMIYGISMAGMLIIAIGAPVGVYLRYRPASKKTDGDIQTTASSSTASSSAETKHLLTDSSRRRVVSGTSGRPL